MQSKRLSITEACTNTLVGYILGVFLQATLFPLYGWDIPFSANLQLVAIISIVSIIRGYVVRRLFNMIR